MVTNCDWQIEVMDRFVMLTDNLDADQSGYQEPNKTLHINFIVSSFVSTEPLYY